MKRKFTVITLLLWVCLTLCFLPACEVRAEGSVKELTKPYIAQYECVEARLGEENLLEQYDYIRIILVDKSNMQVVIKPKNDDKHVMEGNYSLDFGTRELTGEIGILGCKFREKTTVNNGEFVISKTILSKHLYIKFKVI